MGVLDFKEMSFGLLRLYNFLDTTRTSEFLLEILHLLASNMPKRKADTMEVGEKGEMNPSQSYEEEKEAKKEEEVVVVEEAKEEAPSKHSIFPFFELCQELRDLIYDECHEDRTARDIVPNLHLELHNVAVGNLFLVSKAFSSEYRERANKALQSMTITDDCPEGQLALYQRGVYPLPLPAFGVPVLYINIVLLHLNDGADHHNWISQLLRRLPSVRTVHLRAMLDRELVTTGFEDFEIDTQSRRSLATLSRLRSYKCYMRRMTWEGIEDSGRQAILEWSSENGQVELVVSGEEVDDQIMDTPFGPDEEWSDFQVGV